MNSTQRKIFLFAVVLCLLSELFPPWQYEDGQTSARRSAGYHFINSPPAPAPYEKMKQIFSIPDHDPPHHIRVRVNVLRQHAQRTFLAVLTLGLLLATIRRQNFVLRVTGIMVLLAAGGMALMLLYEPLQLWRLHQ
ncbi:MAG TPA: hypothetical protein VGW12_05635 [Pyrinomonadaceae bacterium]|nr:hypothetical protein [Pyrinomonadaceae bacterium]